MWLLISPELVGELAISAIEPIDGERPKDEIREILLYPGTRTPLAGLG